MIQPDESRGMETLLDCSISPSKRQSIVAMIRMIRHFAKVIGHFNTLGRTVFTFAKMCLTRELNPSPKTCRRMGRRIKRRQTCVITLLQVCECTSLCDTTSHTAC